MALQISGASFALLYRRTNSKSIDSTEVWTTLADALTYAANTDDVKYVPIDGLVISVTENNKTYRLVPDESISTEDGKKHYKLEEFALAKDIVSKNLFSSIFGLIDENGNELSLYGDNVIDLTKSIKAKFGLWTELYLSALGMNPADGEVSLTLASLNDVLFSELTEGLSIVWNGTKWINLLIESGGLDESLLEDYLSRNSYATTLDITDAISSKVDTTTFNSTISDLNTSISGIETLLDTKASKDELGTAVSTINTRIDGVVTDLDSVDKDLQDFKGITETELLNLNLKKLDVDFFNAMFGLMDGDGLEITPNSTELDAAASIKAKFGIWTNEFLSAKGLNPDDGEITGLTLGDLSGVYIVSPQDGESLIYQQSSGQWVNQKIEIGNPFNVWLGESEETPTLNNKPASEWVNDLQKEEHVDDYYVTTNGLVYLFTKDSGQYRWLLVSDKYLIDCWNKLNLFDDDLTERVEALEAGSATNILSVGVGNVVTDVTKSGTVITVNKDISVYTKSEINAKLEDYLPLDTAINTGNIGSQSVASAAKLTTARTIWGLSFDGTEDVSGAMSDVTTLSVTTGASIYGMVSREHIKSVADLGDRGLFIGNSRRAGWGISLWSETSGNGYIQQQTIGNDAIYALGLQPFGGNVGIGTTSPSYTLDVSGDAKVSRLVIGDGVIEWDNENQGFKVTGGLYTDTYLSAKGANANGGSSSGGGLITSLYRYADLGKTFADTNNDTFNAYTINKINTDLGNRISVLEGKATNVSFTQSLTSGTQIGTITIDGASKNIYAPTIPTKLSQFTNDLGLGSFAYKSSLAFADLTNKPTTISGYGITDAITTANIGSQSVNYASSAGLAEFSIYTRGFDYTLSNLDLNNLSKPMFWFYGQGDSGLNNVPMGFTYGGGITFRQQIENSLSGQFVWDINHNTSTPTNNLWFRASNNLGWGYDWKIIAFTDSNVASATKLQTARSLWGQSFDGTGNVSGAIDECNWVRYYKGASVSGYIIGRGEEITGGNGLGLWTYGSTPIFFGTGSVTRMTIDTYGNVGIGTDNPQYKLDVNGDLFAVRLKLNNLCFECGQDGSESGCSSEINNFTDYLYLQLHSSLGISMCYGGGNVGIGTISPKYKLDVNGNANFSGCITAGTTGLGYVTRDTLILNPPQHTGGPFYIRNRDTTNNAYIDIAYGYSTLMTLIHNGNVGIGTTSPEYKLDVNGGIRATSAITTSSAITTTFRGGGISGLYPDSWISGANANRLWLYNDYELAIYGSTIEMFSSVNVIGTLHATTGIYSDGYVSAKGQNTSSDMRLKNVLNDVVLNVSDIANAPSVRFAWKNGGGIDVGSSAQYWRGVLPDAVKERDGMLEMQYANIALLSAIAIAKNVETHEERIARLESTIKNLQHTICILRNNVND